MIFFITVCIVELISNINYTDKFFVLVYLSPCTPPKIVAAHYPLPVPALADRALSHWTDFVSICRSSSSSTSASMSNAMSNVVSLPNVVVLLHRARKAALSLFGGISADAEGWFEGQVSGIDIGEIDGGLSENQTADLKSLVVRLASDVEMHEPAVENWIIRTNLSGKNNPENLIQRQRPPSTPAPATIFKAVYVLEKLNLQLVVLAAYALVVPSSATGGKTKTLNEMMQFIKGAHFIVPDAGRLYRRFLELETFLPGKDLAGHRVATNTGALLLDDRSHDTSHYTAANEHVACPSCEEGRCGFSQGQFTNFPIFPNFMLGVAKRARGGAELRPQALTERGGVFVTPGTESSDIGHRSNVVIQTAARQGRDHPRDEDGPTRAPREEDRTDDYEEEEIGDTGLDQDGCPVEDAPPTGHAGPGPSRRGVGRRGDPRPTPTPSGTVNPGDPNKNNASFVLKSTSPNDEIVFTFLQQEGAPYLGIFGDVLRWREDGKFPFFGVDEENLEQDLEHGGNLASYVNTGKMENVGPAGMAPHTEFVAPIELTVPGLEGTGSSIGGDDAGRVRKQGGREGEGPQRGTETDEHAIFQARLDLERS